MLHLANSARWSIAYRKNIYKENVTKSSLGLSEEKPWDAAWTLDCLHSPLPWEISRKLSCSQPHRSCKYHSQDLSYRKTLKLQFKRYLKIHLKKKSIHLVPFMSLSWDDCTFSMLTNISNSSGFNDPIRHCECTDAQSPRSLKLSLPLRMSKITPDVMGRAVWRQLLLRQDSVSELHRKKH